MVRHVLANAWCVFTCALFWGVVRRVRCWIPLSGECPLSCVPSIVRGVAVPRDGPPLTAVAPSLQLRGDRLREGRPDMLSPTAP